jgi:aerobic carbon-monoxide dehydrogenase small subunit
MAWHRSTYFTLGASPAEPVGVAVPGDRLAPDGLRTSSGEATRAEQRRARARVGARRTSALRRIAVAEMVSRHTTRRALAASSDPRSPRGGGIMPAISLTLNGKRVTAEVEARTLLVELLRERLGLTGTHVGCDTSQCGACTVHVDGRSVKSCTLFALDAEGREVTTIEGLARADGTLHPMQEAFHQQHGLQCGFCTPGMVMSAVELVRRDPAATDEQIRGWLEGNLCRCTGYHNIVKAVRAAAAGGGR